MTAVKRQAKLKSISIFCFTVTMECSTTSKMTALVSNFRHEVLITTLTTDMYKTFIYSDRKREGRHYSIQQGKEYIPEECLLNLDILGIMEIFYKSHSTHTIITRGRKVTLGGKKKKKLRQLTSAFDSHQMVAATSLHQLDQWLPNNGWMVTLVLTGAAPTSGMQTETINIYFFSQLSF